VDFLLLTNEVNLNFLWKLKAVVVRNGSKDIVRLLIKDRLVVDPLDLGF